MVSGENGGGNGAQATSAVPEDVAELAGAARQYVLAAVSVELDFTPETLPALDHYLAGAREAAAERPETVDLVARAVGAYFGEVVRRMIDGFWRTPTADVADWTVCSRRAFLFVNPIGIAYEVVAQAADHDGPSGELGLAPEDRETVEQRLAALPDVPEDEYYLLSTRAEVIEIALEALRQEMVDGGQGDVTFDEADYE